MKEVIRIIIQSVQVFLFCGVMLSGALGVLYEIVGHAKFEKILFSIGISNGFEKIWIISAIMLFLLMVIYIIRNKFFN